LLTDATFLCKYIQDDNTATVTNGDCCCNFWGKYYLPTAHMSKLKWYSGCSSYRGICKCTWKI